MSNENSKDSSSSITGFENDTSDLIFVVEACEILVETHPEDEMSNYIYADLSSQLMI